MSQDEKSNKIARRRGPPKVYPEALRLTLPDGGIARIDGVLRDGEDRLSMIRAAIEREIKRRGG